MPKEKSANWPQTQAKLDKRNIQLPLFPCRGIQILRTLLWKYRKGKKGCLNFTETRGEVREMEMNMSLNMTRRHNAINVMALCLRVHYDRIVTGALVFGGIYRSVEWVLHGDGRGLHFELFGVGPARAPVFQNHPIYPHVEPRFDFECNGKRRMTCRKAAGGKKREKERV